MTLTDLVSSLSDNPYFGAGFGLFGLGAVTAMVRKGSQIGFIMFRRHCVTTVEVTCQDKSFEWLLHWITKRGARKSQHLTVDTTYIESESGKISTRYDFQPSVGLHLIFFRGTWIQVERTREQRLTEPWETVQLTTIGKQRQLFADILDEAREMAMEATSGKTIMYTAIGTEWRPFGHPRQKRMVSSVILDENIGLNIVSDVRCGKTSFITALAGELDYSIAVLNLSDRGMSDDRLQHRLADAPENSIILLEDVDAAFVSRDENPHLEAAYQGLNRLTFSGLLNAIDGVTSTEGRILFMTTNYLDRLDPALIRPGRVDVKQYIGYCSHKQLSDMYMKFYPDAPLIKAEEFGKKVIELNLPISAATLQGYFMFFKHSPDLAHEKVEYLQPRKAQ
ncbi:BCS1 [Lepeophtheirus salmonis]|uniref:Mitochondrial chaperone BCS1 n=1 Tax=Lepeophtheirus salmonis TaxID=72036 RepID=A0A7R8CJR2_LEPSM|nr:BCS1 [Lepeophtheirus salmonis]CAF2808370.1 BCS1 [Lepeophtheirus salmonis]